ncbi:SIS domain-containing protein [Duganella hordei]|uniref:SIS domain-containing protein n=1 Tax=Duganella hordei TaxID=2865934 RepID=UPI0030E9B0D7
MLDTNRDILGIDPADLAARGGRLTAGEILQQPIVWGKIENLTDWRRGAVAQFLAPLLALPGLRIVLTGAGSSAFIGDCLAPAMLKQTGLRVEAVPTTDLVSGPERFFQENVPTLLVSFARSGSSPESVAAVKLADQCVTQIYHLVFTCNADGMLYRLTQGQSHALAVLLPDETHDRAFAMTTSFTSMLLAAALAFGVIEDGAQAASALQACVTDMIGRALPLLHALVARRFQRVVYLGSNELKGLAREAALKLLELSDGQVVALFDSTLGFRHGPKCIIDASTLVVVMLSNDPLARRYDLDLLSELRADRRAGQVLALSARDDLRECDDSFLLRHVSAASDVELALPLIVFGQMFAFLQSLALGIRPDTPSVSGTVNRVVSGVTIYPYESEGAYVPRD